MDAVTTVVPSLIAACATVLTALITVRGRGDTKAARSAAESAADNAQAAAQNAETAADLSRPTGNGFAAEVRAQLSVQTEALAAMRAENRAEQRALHHRIDSLHRRVNRLGDSLKESEAV